MSEDREFFGVGAAKPGEDSLVLAFFWHQRNDGWEKVMFKGPQKCGCCGESNWTGWNEMECDAMRCAKCVPPEKDEA